MGIEMKYFVLAAYFTALGLTDTTYSFAKKPKFRLQQSGSCPTLPNFMFRRSRFRIINGRKAMTPIPWQVSIQDQKGKSYCGGTILDERTVVTAAHCLDNATIDYTTHSILAGKVSKKSNRESIRIARVILYPYWDPERTLNDIAVVKLSEPLKLDRTIKSMCLPIKNFKPKRGQRCIVSGWGRTNYSKSRLLIVLF